MEDKVSKHSAWQKGAYAKGQAFGLAMTGKRIWEKTVNMRPE